MTSPSATLTVVAIAHPGDPALDLDAPDAGRLLSAYERSRSEADLAALPVRPGETLTRYHLQPLSFASYAYAFKVDPEGGAAWSERRVITPFFAAQVVLVACHSFCDARGQHTAKTTRSGNITYAEDSWLEELCESGGAKVVVELASVALRRKEVKPGDLDPFALPRGLRLGR